MPDSSPHKRLWFSPHGTSWTAESYEEALEMERDSLHEEYNRLVEQYEDLKRINSEIVDVNTEACNKADALQEQYEDLKRLQASDSKRAYELGNEAERLQRENTRLLEQFDVLWAAVETLRQRVIERPPDTEDRDTYADGFTAGLSEALQIVRVDIRASSPASEPHNDKGFSEERCLRCGWVMGSPALNCNNDDTPHRFPSQEILTSFQDTKREESNL